MSDYVERLLDNPVKQDQWNFVNDPLGQLSTARFTEEEAALFFSMDPELVSYYIVGVEGGSSDLRTRIMQYWRDIASDWPPVGDLGKNPWHDVNVCAPRVPPFAAQTFADAASFSAASAAAIGAAWSAPNPVIHQVWPTSHEVQIGMGFELILSGEGFFPGATIQLEQVLSSPSRPGNLIEFETDKTQHVGWDLCTFRQMYLRVASAVIPASTKDGSPTPRGLYYVYVVNRGWSRRLRWDTGYIDIQ